MSTTTKRTVKSVSKSVVVPKKMLSFNEVIQQIDKSSPAAKQEALVILKSKKSVLIRLNQLIEKEASKPLLSSYPIDLLMLWRNSARVRADARVKRLLELKKIKVAAELEIKQLDKKQHSDLTWISRLQRTLSDKVLG